MKYPLTMSVIIIQMHPGDEAEAQVLVHSSSSTIREITTKLNLGKLTDATDARMWAQMAAASVCDGL